MYIAHVSQYTCTFHNAYIDFICTHTHTQLTHAHTHTHTHTHTHNSHRHHTDYFRLNTKLNFILISYTKYIYRFHVHYTIHMQILQYIYRSHTHTHTGTHAPCGLFPTKHIRTFHIQISYTHYIYRFHVHSTYFTIRNHAHALSLLYTTIWALLRRYRALLRRYRALLRRYEARLRRHIAL